MNKHAKHFANSENSAPEQRSQEQASQVVQLSVVQDKLSKDQLVSLFNDHYDSLVRLASFLLDDTESWTTCDACS